MQAFLLLWTLVAPMQVPASPSSAITIRASIQGETNLTGPFIEAFRRELAGKQMPIEVVPRSQDGLDYNIILAQETSMAGAAAAVIVLDRDAAVVASVVRSGRRSGKGAMNACTKEIAKRIATLKR